MQCNSLTRVLLLILLLCLYRSVFGNIEGSYKIRPDTIVCENCRDADDFDNDGVVNSKDLDDDNDGILDEYESYEEIKTFNNGGFESYPVAIKRFKLIHVGNQDGGFGWQTTDSKKDIEVWGSGYNGVRSYEGNNFVELNANSSSRLFQVFKVKAGELIYYRVSHRARRYHRRATGKDVMDIYIFPDEPNSPNREDDPGVSPIRTVSSSMRKWETYTGYYRVPKNVMYVQLGFMAKSTASGDASVGNFIDDVAFYRVPDSDDDGYPDRLDRDADGDGCWDCAELGFDDFNNDGVPGSRVPVKVDSYGRLQVEDRRYGQSIIDYSRNRLKPRWIITNNVILDCVSKVAIKDLFTYSALHCDDYQFTPDSISRFDFLTSQCGNYAIQEVVVSRVLPNGRKFSVPFNISVLLSDCEPPSFNVLNYSKIELCHEIGQRLDINPADFIIDLEDNCGEMWQLTPVLLVVEKSSGVEQIFKVGSDGVFHLKIEARDINKDYEFCIRYVDANNNSTEYRKICWFHIIPQIKPLTIHWK
ncbi:hypothetical protein OAT16_02125 [Prolixibacteraceae bacterium]|nr:hypothetical protein [Prolixibacteraceae bacterium]